MTTTVQINEQPIRLKFWDTAGQERFKSLVPSYIRDCHIAVVVYDTTNLGSFESVESWVNEVKAERSEECLIVLVGNKVDKADRVITTDGGENLMKKLGLDLFVEVSAKSGLNVKMMFKKIAGSLNLDCHRIDFPGSRRPTILPEPIDLGDVATEDGGCLC